MHLVVLIIILFVPSALCMSTNYNYISISRFLFYTLLDSRTICSTFFRFPVFFFFDRHFSAAQPMLGDRTCLQWKYRSHWIELKLNSSPHGSSEMPQNVPATDNTIELELYSPYNVDAREMEGTRSCNRQVSYSPTRTFSPGSTRTLIWYYNFMP